MKNNNKTSAIVLRRTNYGEADRILQLLTPEGRVNVMARGVRKEKSRLSGGIELFSICEVSITRGRGELGVLTSARLTYFFSHIMEDYDRMQFAYSAIKLVALASESTDVSDWFDLLAELFAGLNNSSVIFELVEGWFYLRYAVLTGYELSLWKDCDGNEIMEDSKYQYDSNEKGLRFSETGDLTSDHIKLLRLMSTKPLKILSQIGGIDPIIKDCLFVTRQHAAV